MNLRETTALVLLGAVWGGSFLFIRISVPALGPLPLMAARVLIAGAILWCVFAALRQPLPLSDHAGGLLVLGSVNAALPFTRIGWAELHLTASLASLLNATVPLFTTLASVFWLQEQLTPRRATGLLVGMVGVGVLVGWNPAAPTGRGLLSVGAMLLAAGTLLLLPGLWTLPTRTPPQPTLWALLSLAVLSTALAYLLYFYLIGRIGPTRTNSVAFLVPVFGMAWGAAFLGEPITRGMLGGLVCILLGLFLVNEVRFPAAVLRSGLRPAHAGRKPHRLR
jgi:drug/metabolite transporter (DMT)-like permease